jgi:hypothetical protein
MSLNFIIYEFWNKNKLKNWFLVSTKFEVYKKLGISLLTVYETNRWVKYKIRIHITNLKYQ